MPSVSFTAPVSVPISAVLPNVSVPCVSSTSPVLVEPAATTLPLTVAAAVVPLIVREPAFAVSVPSIVTEPSCTLTLPVASLAKETFCRVTFASVPLTEKLPVLSLAKTVSPVTTTAPELPTETVPLLLRLRAPIVTLDLVPETVSLAAPVSPCTVTESACIVPETVRAASVSGPIRTLPAVKLPETALPAVPMVRSYTGSVAAATAGVSAAFLTVRSPATVSVPLETVILEAVAAPEAATVSPVAVPPTVTVPKSAVASAPTVKESAVTLRRPVVNEAGFLASVLLTVTAPFRRTVSSTVPAVVSVSERVAPTFTESTFTLPENVDAPLTVSCPSLPAPLV